MHIWVAGLLHLFLKMCDRVWRRLSTDVPESLFEDGMEARCFPQARLAQMLALAGRKVKGGGAGVITVVVQSELG